MRPCLQRHEAVDRLGIPTGIGRSAAAIACITSIGVDPRGAQTRLWASAPMLLTPEFDGTSSLCVAS